MSQMISYAIGYTPIDGSATSVTVTPPPAYQAGNLLVMGVIGGGATAAAAATAPSGWTAPAGSGTPGLFYKTASASEPASYTVTLSSAATVAVFVAAYPAATVVSSAFRASGNDVTSYSPAFPPGVTSGQTVLMAAAAVASASDVNGNSGYQNVVLPQSGWTTDVPVFGPARPGVTTVLPCAVGLAEVAGSTSSPLLTSPQGCNIYAGYLVLNVTGAPPSLMTVTATLSPPAGQPGLALTVKALSGAATPAAIEAGGAASGYYAGGVSGAPAAAITPNASGSYVYGSLTQNFGVTGGATFTPNASTTFSQNVPDSTWDAIYGTLRSSAKTTAHTPVTLGGTAPANAYTTGAFAEILAAAGSTLAETATATAAGTAPGNFATTSVSRTAVFTAPPAPGTLLVALVSGNSNFFNGAATASITDSLGLTWVPLAQQGYPSYSGVFTAQVTAPGADAVLDEGGGTVLDEGGSSPAPSAQAHRATAGKAAARRGTSSGSPGAKYVFTPVIPAPFAQPSRPVPGRQAARRGASLAGNPGAAYVYVPVIPAPFAQPPRPVPAHSLARHGTAAGSRGAPYAFTPAYPPYVVLDESGNAVLDEGGNWVEDESGALASAGPWTAARAGLPGDSTAANWASQVSQFLVGHGIVPVYGGNRAWTVAQPAASENGSFYWLDATTQGFLPYSDVSQPFTLPPGTTTAGRLQVPVTVTGSGADLEVTLCPDDGSGNPLLSAPLASVTVPAEHIAALSATGSLATAGPLATSRYNTACLGTASDAPWTQPAVSANGAGSYATPATSGAYTALIGGWDSTAGAATGYVAVVSAQGTVVSGGVTQPALPKATTYACAVITTDSVVAAGGQTTTGTAAVWTAPWDPGTGTIGAWSSQQALPAAVVFGAMASWGTTVYVIGGSPTGAASAGTSAVWTAASSSGQVTAWTAGPSLPVKLQQAYCAVIGNWLVVAGGMSTAGTALASTWYSAVNADGSLAGWQQGPALPQACYAFGPNWNTAVTDSALVIISGITSPSLTVSPYTQVLSVSPDGPADAWQLQNWAGSVLGTFQSFAAPAGPPGQWQVYNLHVTSFDTGTLYPVPLLSVPLPAAGLTPGATYHAVFHQAGGSITDSLAVGVMESATGAGWQYAARGSGGPWTTLGGSQVALNVLDATPGGPVLHLVQDSGAGVTTLTWSGASGLLNGVLESAVFPSGSPRTALPSVVQVTYGAGGVPAGLLSLT